MRLFDPCGSAGRFYERRAIAAILALSLLGLIGGCASPRPSGRPSEAAPTVIERDAPRPLESANLHFARTVLAHRADGKLDADQRERVARVLANAEREHGFPVILALAVIELESGFDPDARGPAGSVGLMQLQPQTARALARRLGLPWSSDRSLLDPELNARLGLQYLAEMQSEFGSVEGALAAYNIGPARLRRLLEQRPLKRGPYLTKVYAHADAFREAYGE